jgi:hypothetical protein
VGVRGILEIIEAEWLRIRGTTRSICGRGVHASFHLHDKSTYMTRRPTARRLRQQLGARALYDVKVSTNKNGFGSLSCALHVLRTSAHHRHTHAFLPRFNLLIKIKTITLFSILRACLLIDHYFGGRIRTHAESFFADSVCKNRKNHTSATQPWRVPATPCSTLRVPPAPWLAPLHLINSLIWLVHVWRPVRLVPHLR